jgi:NADPH:quinone reductase-like Zn-dependent oxidoreductase
VSPLVNHRIVIPRRGGPEVLQLIEEDAPHPGTDEIRVKTLASGVSGHDTMLRRAWFPGFPQVPFTPGVDIVGLVDELGREALGFEPGEVVAALLPAEGGYSEYVCVPAIQAVSVPRGVDPAEAVCVVANYLTAYAMLHRGAKVQSGESVLIHGVAGGVGSALLELSSMAGLELYGTASPHNHELLRSRGVTPIDYRNEDFVRRIRQLTGDGVDVVFDPIGGARQLWRSYRALRKGGRLIWFGVAATSRAGMGVIPASLIARLFISMIPEGKKAPMPPDASKPNAWYRETLNLLLDYLATGKINPLVAERIPLNRAERAHELMDQGGNAGKVVLVGSD